MCSTRCLRLNTLQLTHSDVSCSGIDDYARLLIVLSESIVARVVKIVIDGGSLQGWNVNKCESGVPVTAHHRSRRQF